MMEELNRQIDADGLEKKVEICTLCDNREMTTGAKRNRLLAMANGQYTVFIDDDDRIAPDYIRQVISGIETDYPDVIGLVGVITMPDNTGRQISRNFYHTLRNTSYWESARGYERPPNHLNPMRRDIAIQYQFPDKVFGEDTDWAMKINMDRRLKSEYYITSPLYFYDYNPAKTY
jgi:glycosyltransferase involved in cell wall biosynthesis